MIKEFVQQSATEMPTLTLRITRTEMISGNAPVRFAVGDPAALTSHSWRAWVERGSELYLACRDTFKDTKISLHASGRWRMGYTQQAVQSNPSLVDGGKNRAWDVWNKPGPVMPGVILAFSIYFPTSEFVMTRDQRRSWKDIRYISAATSGRVNVVSVCISDAAIEVNHTDASVELGRFDLGGGKCACLIAHDADGADTMQKVKRFQTLMINTVRSKGLEVTPDYFAYFLAHRPDGCRNLLGVKMPQEAEV